MYEGSRDTGARAYVEKCNKIFNEVRFLFWFLLTLDRNKGLKSKFIKNCYNSLSIWVRFMSNVPGRFHYKQTALGC